MAIQIIFVIFAPRNISFFLKMYLFKTIVGNTHKLLTAFFMCVIFMIGSVSVAQNMNSSNLSKSPYNRYGYGKLGSLSNSVTRSMGDLGVAIRSNGYTNLANPASLTAIDTLTMIFSMGLEGQYGIVQEGNLTDNNWDAGFSYMSFHFPLWRNFAMSLSLSPYSVVGYSYGSLDKKPINSSTNKHDSLAVASTYGGVGGINNFMMGIGWRLWRNKMNEANLGVNVGFLFGTIQHDAVLSTSSQATGTYVSHDLDARGLMLGLGMQYTHRFNATRSMTVGATFQPKLNLSVDTHEMKYSTDTVMVSERYRSAIKTPMKWGIGVTYEVARNLMVSAEYETVKWSQVNGFNSDMVAEANVFNDVNRFAAGVEYLPKALSRSYFQTCRYRLGFSTQGNYLKVKDASLQEYSLTAGMSLPVNKRSALDFGLGYTRLQPSVDTMVKENYFTFTLGVTFNEMMFFRNKLR